MTGKPETTEKEDTEEEAHALNVQMRIDEEAKGIISNVDPETRKYFAELKKKLGIK